MRKRNRTSRSFEVTGPSSDKLIERARADDVVVYGIGLDDG